MQFTSTHYACPSCGAYQKFSAITGKLTCEFCTAQTEIPTSSEIVETIDFKETLLSIRNTPIPIDSRDTSCQKCGASFAFKPHSISTNCPYCDVPAIIECLQEIKPKSIIPFSITRKDARSRFKKWVASRWFAPNAFKKYLNDNKILLGYYLPHWTYDTDTTSQYRGERGDKYYVTVTKTVVEDGREKQVQVQESRIRWTSVSGTVYVDFNDVIVGASPTISRSILDSLEPWEIPKLLPFDDKYLSGFEAEEYTTGLDEGFTLAKDKMSPTIRNKIKRDIGGDEQRISSTNTQYNNKKFKNALFPIWTASFKWNKKEYNYAINAQTGKIVGERPYSIVKIAFAVMGAGTIITAGVYYQEIMAYFMG